MSTANVTASDHFGASIDIERLWGGSILSEDIPQRGVRLAEPTQWGQSIWFNASAVSHEPRLDMKSDYRADNHQTLAEVHRLGHHTLKGGWGISNERWGDAQCTASAKASKGELVDGSVDRRCGDLHHFA